VLRSEPCSRQPRPSPFPNQPLLLVPFAAFVATATSAMHTVPSSDCASYSGTICSLASVVDAEGSTIIPAAGAQGGVFQVAPGGANGSAYALRVTGSIAQASIVYAGMGMNFVDPKGPYDASKYKGISFWAKKSPGTTRHVRLKVPDKNTDPDGKVCSACFNDFGFDLKLADEWTQYVIPFDRMSQLPAWGSPHTGGIDSNELYAIQFQVNDKGQKYDVWVDEVAFTGCE
jgi:endoglucanase